MNILKFRMIFGIYGAVVYLSEKTLLKRFDFMWKLNTKLRRMSNKVLHKIK